MINNQEYTSLFWSRQLHLLCPMFFDGKIVSFLVKRTYLNRTKSVDRRVNLDRLILILLNFKYSLNLFPRYQDSSPNLNDTNISSLNQAVKRCSANTSE